MRIIIFTDNNSFRFLKNYLENERGVKIGIVSLNGSQMSFNYSFYYNFK